MTGRTRIRSVGAGLLLAAVSAAAQAGHDADGNDQALVNIGVENLLDLEVYTASRFPQARAEAPSALTVITADEIRTYGYRSLDEILRSVPGVHISYDHVYKYLGVRGLRRPQDFNSPVLLLVDGQRLNDGIYDSAPIGEDFPVDVELIDRVEFVRGPGSSVYGSNALLGVINVITRAPAVALGHRLSLTAGDAGSAQALAQWGLPLNEHSAYLLLAASKGQRDGDDYHLPAFDDPAGDSDGVARNLDRDQQQRLMAKLDAGDWGLQMVYGQRSKEAPLPIYGADFNDPRNRYADTHAFASLRYEPDLNDRWSLQTRLFNGYYRFAGELAYDTVLNQDRATGRRWGAETRLLYNGWTHHRLLAGLEYTDDYRLTQLNFDESPYAAYLDLHRRDRRYGLLLQDEWQLHDDFKLTGGLRHDHGYGRDLTSPRLALIHRPARGHSLKLLYGRAFRAPSSFERFYAALGYAANPDLVPERTTNWDLLWEAYPMPSLRLQLGLQRFVIDDFIVEGVEPGSGNIQYLNDRGVQSNGIDVDLEKFWGGGWQGRASLSLQRARRQQGDNRDLPDAPNVLGKFSLSGPLPWLGSRAGLEVHGSNQRRSLQGNAESYVLANLTLSGLRLHQGLSLSGSIYNVLDHQYSDPTSSDLSNQGVDLAAQRGREFRVGLDWLF